MQTIILQNCDMTMLLIFKCLSVSCKGWKSVLPFSVLSILLYLQAGITHSNVMHLAIFNVFPLQTVGILEINKKVRYFVGFVNVTHQVHPDVCSFYFKDLFIFQVFGNGVTDVLLSQGIMVVSYSNKLIKLYSFEQIVQKVDCMHLVRHSQYYEICLWSCPSHFSSSISKNVLFLAVHDWTGCSWKTKFAS